MATILSDTPLAENLTLWQGVFVPFTVFLKIDPIMGKRIARYRDMEKLAALIENQLSVQCPGSDDYVRMDFAKPVAFTPQFGQKTARLTVHGHACLRDNWVKEPINEVLVDSPNGLQTGYDASNKANAIPVAALNLICKEIKTYLEGLTNLQVIKIDMAGYIYGVKGSHFPQ